MRLVLGQTGAPTTVVNRSVEGFLLAAGGHDVRVALGGPDTLVAGTWTPLTEVQVSTSQRLRGGSWLGGGRRRMSDEDVDSIVDRLADDGIEGLALIGGNGTMDLLRSVASRCARRGLPLAVVGIPKTIDNDLHGADPAPGFASAARYLSTVLPELAADHRAMTSVEPVRIVETMGRATGWLALAATLPSEGCDPVVHRVYIPEVLFDSQSFLDDTARTVARHGRALVVVSEGVAPELSAAPVHAANHTTLITGGVSRAMAAMVTAELGLPARGDVLGVTQRCAAHLESGTDAHHADAVGRSAATHLLEAASHGALAHMVGISSDGSYPLVPLADVAGRTRAVPGPWRSSDPRDLGTFHTWLSPLLHPAVTPPAASVPHPMEAL